MRAAAMCAALGGLCAALAAQKQSTGPRALAVVQTDTRGQRRLLPIAIQVEGRFYDAGIYKASPLPMALEPGTVYEVEQNGDPLGLFTIEQARPAATGSWFATGQWQDKHAIEEAKRKAAPPPQPKTEKADVEDRPVLRKSPRGAPSPGPGSPPASTPTGGTAPNTAPPPTMGTPAETSGGSSPGSPARPAASPSAPPDDAHVPGRPVLRRGQHEEESSSDIGAAAGARPGAPAAKTSPRLRFLAAVSDADGPEPRSYLFTAKPGEESEFRAKVVGMAQAVVAAYEKSRRPSFAAAQIAPAEFRMFDLDYSNQPVMVLTASARIVDRTPRRRAGPAAKPEAAPDAIVTMVARQDIYGELQPVFSSVTDPRHLDEFPRLELIDAVDADGDGRGELLFRETTDSNTGWVIYKAGMDKLSRIFDTFAPSD